MITFSNGRSISTIVISTALGIDGMGIFPRTLCGDYKSMASFAHSTQTTIFGKSMTRHKRIGNFRIWRPWTWKYIQKFGADGMLNAYGLTNCGVEAHSGEIAQAADIDVRIIPNIFPFFNYGKEAAAKDVLETIDILRAKMGKNFWALELSFSCPNTKECIADNTDASAWLVKQAKDYAPDIIFVAKTSIVHPYSFACQLYAAGADVIHAVNSIPYYFLFSGVSPLHKAGGGGVSGGPAFERAFEYVSKLIEYYEGPIIVGCGIVDDEKLERCFRLMSGWENFYGHSGNSVAYSICTAALFRPKWVKKQIENYNDQ